MSRAFIAHDCAKDYSTTKAYSLNYVDRCIDIEQNPKNATTRVQVVKYDPKEFIYIYMCNIKSTRLITVCGNIASYSSIPAGAISTYVMSMTKDVCLGMHEDHAYIHDNGYSVDNLKSNSTTQATITMVGTTSLGGRCSRSNYSESGVIWKNVVVTVSLEITLADDTSVANTELNRIRLSDSLSCKFSDGQCIDHNNGMVFWNYHNIEKCNQKLYTVIYGGMGTKFYDDHSHLNEIDGMQRSFLINTDEKLIWMTATKPIRVCGYLAYQIKHPNIIIIEYQGYAFAFSRKSHNPLNIDMSLYLSSRFVTYDKHVEYQLDELFKIIQQHKCQLEAQLVESTIHWPM
ncbi:hypothetical protein QAD02_019779 [Eretmocerus hayati]|uniref:Uncharacterized protein n=1 Tax=Eretmocerus hayati TaxID=131215 RepID=A0ACC2PKK0_9HYME|nr:hypothetical protein QAD02_019779 [Eretmocerus hayati]